MTASIFLTADELRELTGYRTPTHQRRWLDAHRIPYLISGKGQPRILRALLVARLGGATISEQPPAAREPRLHLR